MVLRWACIDWWLQEIVLEGVGEGALHITDDTRDNADDGICHYRGSQFAACEDIVADADLAGDEVFPDAVVDALVVTADDDDVLLQRELVRHGLVELLAVWSRENDFVVVAFCLQRRDAGIQRLALDEHTRCTAKGIVVHTTMLVRCVVSEVVHMNLSKSLLLSPAEDAFLGERFYQLWQNRDDIYSHDGWKANDGLELAPSLDLDIIQALCAEGIDECGGEAGVGDERNVEVDGCTTNLVAIGEFTD